MNRNKIPLLKSPLTSFYRVQRLVLRTLLDPIIQLISNILARISQWSYNSQKRIDAQELEEAWAIQNKKWELKTEQVKTAFSRIA